METDPTGPGPVGEGEEFPPMSKGEPTKEGALSEEEIREGDALADGEVDPSDELPHEDEAA